MDITATAENGDNAVRPFDGLEVPFPKNPKFEPPPAPQRGESVPSPGESPESPSVDARAPAAEQARAPEPEAAGSPPGEEQNSQRPQCLADVDKLIERSKQGDPAALAAVEEFFADPENPLWREAGNLAALARKTLVAQVNRKSPAQALSGNAYAEYLLKQLDSEDNAPLEKLMIERVLIAWLFACAVDLSVAAGGLESVKEGKHAKAQELAEKRLQTAVKTLELARQISRRAAGRPLRLWGARPAAGDSSMPEKVAG